MVDLIHDFPEQVIEGVDIHDIRMALMGSAKQFQYTDHNTIIHIPTGKRIILDCVQKYFLPPKSYYRLDNKSECSFIRHAMGGIPAGSCRKCFLFCLDHGLEIRYKPVRIAKDYFER